MPKTQQQKRNEEQAEHFRQLGSVVYDVASLLEHAARIDDNDLHAAYPPKLEELRAHLDRVHRGAMLVSSEALKGVVKDLNDLSMEHGFRGAQNGDE